MYGLMCGVQYVQCGVDVLCGVCMMVYKCDIQHSLGLVGVWCVVCTAHCAVCAVWCVQCVVCTVWCVCCVVCV